jgi:septal ring factor EnvC (AmiA/AmiB activator)
MPTHRLILPIVVATTLAATLLAGAAYAVVSERLERLNVEQVELSREQALNMSRMARLLSVLEQIRRDPPPPLLVRPEDARDAVRAAILVRAMTPELRRQAQIYAREAGEMMRQRRLAAVESEALFTTDSLRAETAPQAASGAPPSPQSAPSRPPESLLWPVRGTVSRRYGDTLSGGGKSNGLTLSTTGVAQVVSSGAGVVQYVGPVQGWGVVVILRLAGGYHLVLAGLERSSVEAGQSVAAGQAVGVMPDSRQSLSELYLEVRDQGAPVNPETWLENRSG